MSKEVTVIHIKYNGYNPDLDVTLETALTAKGFELTGKGFDMVSEERDLSFQREERNGIFRLEWSKNA